MRIRRLIYFPGWYIHTDHYTLTFTREKTHRLSWRIVFVHHFQHDDKRYVIYLTPWRR